MFAALLFGLLSGCGLTVNKPGSQLPQPTASCVATPDVIAPGASSRLKATPVGFGAVSVKYVWTTTSGELSSRGSVATLGSAGIIAGHAIVTCNIHDVLGRTAVGQATVTVKPASLLPSSVGMDVSPNPAAAGAPVNVALAVSSTQGRISGWAAGSVSLFDNGVTVASTQLGRSDQTVFSLRSLSAGTHTLLASYSGDGVLKDAQSLPVELVVTSGSQAPAVPQPPSISCSAVPGSIDQGSSTTIRASAASAINGSLTYAYSTTAGSLSWSGATAVLNTESAPAGNAVITCQVTEDNSYSAYADTTVMINAHSIPPTISCSANPSVVEAGDAPTISATADGPQSRSLSFTFIPAYGSITGTGSTVTLNTQGAPIGPDSVICRVTDDRGLSASNKVVVTIDTPPIPGAFSLAGLTSPATVAESIFVFAAGVPSGASVAFYVDGVLKRTETEMPYWMGGQHGSVPAGFSVASLSTGTHTLGAIATLLDGTRWASTPTTLRVIASANAQFSSTLARYVNHPSAQSNTVESFLRNTTTAGATLSPIESATRRNVMAMYLNWGIDPSLDYQNDQSNVLLGLLPQTWAPSTSSNIRKPPSMWFSPDAPFYHPIPAEWPRVALPAKYFAHVQLNTARDGDGIGYGEVTAISSDPPLIVQSQWYANSATHKSFLFRMPIDWSHKLPSQTLGDSHMLFIDPVSFMFVSSYKTTRDSRTGGPDALYAGPPTPFNSLGDHGGSTAAGFAELPVVIQPGEATDPDHPIQHAIGGPLGRTWAARVYPATAWDSGLRTSVNSCTNTGFTNTGLVPYGAVIQLDPKLDLTKLKLSLPALRILQAMQTYGYYVMDFGCANFDIYTAIEATELDPYGGLWGYNKNGPGVQNEIEDVITNQMLYVVAPLYRKQ